jgi:hypothetical protein
MSTMSIFDIDFTKCVICEKDTNLIEFSCNKKYCKQCFHKVIISNRDSIINSINKDDVTLYCLKCNTGYVKLNKQQLQELIHTTVDDQQPKTVELCSTHKEAFQMTCTTCRVKLCFTCLKNHLTNHSEHFFTSIKNDISTICSEHYMNGKKYEYKCITCNKSICQNCATESHSLHTIKCLITFEKENIEKMRREFPFRDDQEICEYIDRHFNGLMVRLKDVKDDLFKQCADIVETLTNLQIQFEKRYGSIKKDIELTKTILRDSLLKYNNEVKNHKRLFYINLNMRIEKDDWLKAYIDSDTRVELGNIQAQIETIKENYLNRNLLNIESIRKGDYIKVLNDHSQSIVDLQKYDDRKFISLSNDNTIRIWDCKGDYECVKRISLNFKHHCLLPMKDGRLACGAWNNTIDIIESNNNLMSLKGHNGSVYCLTLLKDGKLASGSADYTIKVWDNGLICIKTLEGHTNWVRCLLSIGVVLASGSNDMSIKLWDVSNYTHIKTLLGHTGYVMALMLIKGGRFASASGDTTIRIWDLQDYQCINTLKGHTSTVNALLLYKDVMVVSGSSDPTIRLWDMQNDYECIRVIRGSYSNVNCLAIVRNGRIAIGSGDNTIKILNKLN